MPATKLDKAERSRELRAAREELTRAPIAHPRFIETFDDLQLFSESSPMVLLLGVAGAGKTYMAERLVESRCAVPLRLPPHHGDGDGERIPGIAAVVVTAPSAQRRAFSWKALWIRVLIALEDLLPDRKFDAAATAAALRDGRRRAYGRLTEAQLVERVYEAAADRGLELLVIDEACSMLKSDDGRTLDDQLDVLRELADVSTFNVVLVSTFRIVQHINYSSELNRRLAHVVLHRYLGTSEEPGCEEDYINFCRVAASLMERVPAWARIVARGALLASARFQCMFRSGSVGPAVTRCTGIMIMKFPPYRRWMMMDAGPSRTLGSLVACSWWVLAPLGLGPDFSGCSPMRSSTRPIAVSPKVISAAPSVSTRISAARGSRGPPCRRFASSSPCVCSSVPIRSTCSIRISILSSLSGRLSLFRCLRMWAIRGCLLCGPANVRPAGVIPSGPPASMLLQSRLLLPGSRTLPPSSARLTGT